MTRREIIEGIKQGRKTAERTLYQQNKSICTQYALQKFFLKRSTGETIRCTREDAEELYNDACVLFIQNVLKGRIDQLEVKISTYLITSMRYTWMNKARAFRSAPDNRKVEIPESAKESMRINVRKAISQLDDKCREMMTYRYILGWEDYDDIAEATGKSNGDVVRNLISRCRKRFRELYVHLTNVTGPDKTVDYETN